MKNLSIFALVCFLLLSSGSAEAWRPYRGVSSSRVSYIHPYVNRHGRLFRGYFRQKPYYNPAKGHGNGFFNRF